MSDRYEDATEEELSVVDDNCAICRDTMQSAKKLPCGHMFHRSCLRGWVQYQPICPICRTRLIGGRNGPTALANGANGANGGVRRTGLNFSDLGGLGADTNNTIYAQLLSTLFPLPPDPILNGNFPPSLNTTNNMNAPPPSHQDAHVNPNTNDAQEEKGDTIQREYGNGDHPPEEKQREENRAPPSRAAELPTFMGLLEVVPLRASLCSV
eukprot:TRINITY_DN2066_c0_g1_i1.p1 TRINITY_DN2066_c0_g1~~TRINITY_DN2066_c0_g1_i1.p1  ORF type:complete len:210 (-),score=34.46 TRINITY_DN2066_c0_g1_i1:399-1028(-)